MTAAESSPDEPGSARSPSSPTQTNAAPQDTDTVGETWARPYGPPPEVGGAGANGASAAPVFGGLTPLPVATAPERSLGREFAFGGLVLGVLAVLGIPLGLLWQAIAPRVELVATENSFRYTTESPEGYAGDDGVFTFLGLGLGLLAAIAVWALLRRHRGPVQVAALVLGSIAAQVVAWRFGEWWGRIGFEALLDNAQPGEHLFRPPRLLMINFDPGEAWDTLLAGKVLDVGGHLQLGVLATMALASVFVYTVLAGWSRYQSLSRETEPRLPTMQTTTPDAGNETAGRLPS
ncbi:DUF2567 domain-containing protein [Phytomonospora endophytica]|uniref:Putative membrane protein n=1 Tax=Phytomonospora endophytica TaxID=714109 RepID=A0A841FCP8_9ACTN|nr:DUF2567 domain-containing protein [Phytomonospora endophytica]MBB6032783.1 putative membrane protein [Phytomonospora endophytica]GIG66068.1 hypothetical protein Pen01_23630 [Phytomonospora endophytica]